MSSYSAKDIIRKTTAWIADFVILHKLCPFAAVPFESKNIDYRLSEGTDIRQLVEYSWACIEELKANMDVSNIFIITPSLAEFSDQLDLQYSLNNLLTATSYDQYFQTVAFHPNFLFDGEEKQHAGNYVNRSPYGMIHILRTDEVSKATASLPDPEEVPRQNKVKLEELGSEFLLNNLIKYQL